VDSVAKPALRRAYATEAGEGGSGEEEVEPMLASKDREVEDEESDDAAIASALVSDNGKCPKVLGAGVPAPLPLL